ncbi:helix-turn-helix transcriptional regulator [Myxococcota bacterium]|nr:helix-turn-helix transcriptional regulator [Myxococcota bacterium]
MDDRTFHRIGTALGDSRRNEMLQAIAREGEISCMALAHRFPVGISTLSLPWKVPAESDLVRVRREGRHGFFTLDREVLEEWLRSLATRLSGEVPSTGEPGDGNRRPGNTARLSRGGRS